MRLTCVHQRPAAVGMSPLSRVARQGVWRGGGNKLFAVRGFFAAAPRRSAELAVVPNKPMYDQVAGNLENTQISSSSAKHDLVFPFQIKVRQW